MVITENPPYAEKSIESVEPYVEEFIIGTIRINKELLEKLRHNPKCRFFPVSSDIPFADLVKEDLKQHAKYDYILYLDPDELVPQKTWKIIEMNMEHFDSFAFPRKNIIFGKWIEHSRWWPDYQLRLFKKDTVIWPKEIHPEPVTKGREFQIPADERNAIIHYNYGSIDEYLTKARRYARSEAITYIQNKTDLTLPNSIRKSLTEFVSRFFANEGYRDGSHGFILAVLQMFYYVLIYMYYWELKKYPQEKLETLLEANNQFFTAGVFESNYWMLQKRLVSSSVRFKKRIVNKIIKSFGTRQ